jgi:hypothetical protein
MPYKMLNVVATIALGWLVSTGLAGPSFAQDPQKKLPYPNVTDISHATNKVAHIFEGFFSAKSLHDGVTMVSFFGPDPVLYIDAGLGFAWPSRAALLQVWTNPPFSTANPDALSYPLRVIGDCHSALIEFVELRSTTNARSSVGSITGMAAVPRQRSPSEPSAPIRQISTMAS